MINRDEIIQNIGIKQFTDMQKSVLSEHSLHKNLLILSPTGSGKTLAYLIASFEKLRFESENCSEVVIIAPTRELAIQIGESLKECGTSLRSATLYGGRRIADESNLLRDSPKIIIATPGRLADHLRRGNISPEKIHHVVIDEFDKCVEMGFDDDLIEVFSHLQEVETRIFTSATKNDDIPKFVGFRDYHTIDFTQDSTPLEEGNIETKVIECADNNLSALYTLLCSLQPLPTLVFCNYRESCERVSDYLQDRGVICDFYHGAQEQYIRERALLKLRIGAVNILVATDIAARGLDIDSLGYVIHFEQPLSLESFVHRSGRTGRMNGKGENFIITRAKDLLPLYITQNATSIELPNSRGEIAEPKNSMLYIGAGRKQKISKGDIVGFLTQKCTLPPSKIGMIKIGDNDSYAAIERSYAESTIRKARGTKIKKEKPLFRIIGEKFKF